MGSDAHLVVLGGPPGLADLARDRLADLERRWSRFLPDSELSQLNRAAGAPVVVSPETHRVVAAAVEAWRWSGGRFDPTVGHTMERAGYDRPRPAEGWSSARPSSHLACPTPAGIVIDPYPGSVTLPPGVAIDLGGIGKGAAADLVAEELLAAGAGGCCINLGGDVRVAGRPPRPEGWRIEIDHEVPPPGGPAGRPATDGGPRFVGVVDGAVCTSTTTRRTWQGPLGPEHHLRDPTTGAPVRSGLVSVTVIGARATQAEVLTKTAVVGGPAAAAAAIARAGATGVLTADDGRTILLDGIGPFVAAGAAEPVAVDR
jgi:thiamine biosynthesis lipoprotein